LRREAQAIGFNERFTIYDQADSRTAIKQCIKELQLDEKIYTPTGVASRISNAKNNLITPAAYRNNGPIQEEDHAGRRGRTSDIYDLYVQKCKRAGAMDFDDLLLNTNILFQQHPEALEGIRNRFSYILVDEYQDTNYAQYLILKKLAAEHRNICVVGDDAQSIYGFRGARIENILSFKKDYPNARVIRLEQNYRSTSTIVNAANSVISKNEHRMKKECFSAVDGGEKIKLLNAYSAEDEGVMIASSIADRIYGAKASYDQFAILYRTNSQSRTIEEALRRRNMPYRVLAGFSFYDRSEVKDMMAYFRIVVNPQDDEAFRRIINFPPRGIGDTTMERLSGVASEHSLPLTKAAMADDAELAAKGLKPGFIKKLRDFVGWIYEKHTKVAESDAYTIAVDILNSSGAYAALKADGTIEGMTKFENVQELYNSIKDFCDEERTDSDLPPTLGNYLENTALLSSAEREESEGDEDGENKISLMTIHASKGLEFPYVYIAGMEENLFPSGSDLKPTDIEEERRLFYVGVTRAMKAVTLSHAESRMKWGKTENNPLSRFVGEIDAKYIEGRISSPAHAGYGRSRQQEWGDYHSSNRTFTSRPATQKPQNVVQTRPQRPPQAVQHSAPIADFTPSPVSELKIGQRIEHDHFGYGVILQFIDEGPARKAIVDFGQLGRKTLLLKYAKLRVV
ncbi:MAG: UvrD-helicase domain-containing protein, partial [Bacteroidales bacterium]|nr:UvrD-helicase domain-containing protein [Bacteroidales bacterium]